MSCVFTDEDQRRCGSQSHLLLLPSQTDGVLCPRQPQGLPISVVPTFCVEQYTWLLTPPPLIHS